MLVGPRPLPPEPVGRSFVSFFEDDSGNFGNLLRHGRAVLGRHGERTDWRRGGKSTIGGEAKEVADPALINSNCVYFGSSFNNVLFFFLRLRRVLRAKTIIQILTDTLIRLSLVATNRLPGFLHDVQSNDVQSP